MIFRKLIITLLLLSPLYFLFSQNSYSKELTYEQIEKKIDAAHGNDVELWKMIRIYIEKAKYDQNPEALVFAYRYASNFSKFPENLKYADSALVIGKSSNDKRLLANAYLNRGIVFMSEVKYEKALADILISHDYAEEIENDYILYKSKYFISQNKVYLGLYEDANKELRECLVFFKKNKNNSTLGKDYQMYYLYSLMSLIDTNSRLGYHQDNKVLLDEAFDYIQHNRLEHFFPYFISSQGTDAFYRKDYNTAIKKLTQALRLYKDQWDHITEIFYLGKSYWNLGKPHIAVKYFETIDKEYNKSNNLEPQFREAYELLIKYNDSVKNRDLQLEYINKLMQLDKSYEKNYKYLSSTLHKQYDTKKLIEEKEKIESSLKTRDTIIYILFAGILVIVGLSLYRIYHIQITYRKRFNELISEKNIEQSPSSSIILPEAPSSVSEDTTEYTTATPQKEKNSGPHLINEQQLENFSPLSYYSKIPGINPQVVENVLTQLEEFEADFGFLDNQVSQKQLSEMFGTNSTYLSRIINAYKGKKFSTYINDLRLDYILHLLKTDWTYLKKDVKELSQITGFNSAENFSDNFQRKFKIKPSYFIKLMKEKIESSETA
ncbi:AraC family transcriptional regulator [Chryseobacterium lacus]|nr:AraC family transcriptional regulator [Chryseobacterium lacus]